ncbi:neither inactivation nor afterpotential protein C isoform X2 [Venturia canescens]|uniref:neither inactivation nor afterpotential protein C isoform X2 n=1 Tax=Venturia canescens TaxID=32260 RepID=UPI001C9C4298|nr:neither inactivation nor afterpotential protein C isoform X2 [Venturia canescens]
MSDYGRRGGGRRGDFEDDYDYELPRENAGGGARRRTRDEGYDMRGGGGGGGDHGGPGTLQRLDSIQDPGKRYMLNDVIGSGVCADVYEAVDTQAGNKRVAVKVQKLTPESQALIVEEYRVFRDFAGHPNLPDFYGIYRKRSGRKGEFDQIWFAMEYCEGGPVMDLVRGLVASDKKMREEHIAYILKEVIKALVHLHENNVIHRDVQGSNILLTKEGEVRLVDFGLTRMIKGEMGKRNTSIGSPCWMAPEVVMSNAEPPVGYGSRADVWAIGITAIELADGKPPFQDMHPTRALFQIVRNPPPGLYRPANWSQNFNDFIAECLEKNPDNRPFMAEIMEHPFLSELPENDYPLTQEIKALALNYGDKGKVGRKPDVIVRKGFLKTHQTDAPEQMLTEDLAALEILTEDAVLDELHARLRRGYFHTFIGDVLLIINPNEIQDIYGPHMHAKYQCKSRSDNAPHIYSVADSAFQDAFHNEEPQHILLAGESHSGKTTNVLHVVKHLMYLGKGLTDTGNRVMKAMQLIHAFCHAATPLNPNSTRCVLQTQTTFGSTGKASGAIFWLYQLEKWRVSTRDRNQSNFHIFYYFYDGLEATNKLRQYSLTPGRKFRYMRIGDKSTGNKRSFKVRNDPAGNSLKYSEMREILKLMEMEEHEQVIWKTLAAILILGEVKFTEGNNGEAEVESVDTAEIVADHLGLDSKKFIWSLTNYCLIRKGAAVRRRHTCEEAREARDVLANTLYQRLVDWLVNNINEKLTVTRALFGDKFSISILDLFGFECFAVNRIEQLVVNTMNEQLQCHYNQRIFAWEMQEQQEEEIPVQQLHFYDNKAAIDQLMGKSDGLFHIIDEASRQLQDAQYILEKINRRSKNMNVKSVGTHEFTVAHYTGKLIYDASEISEKNRDFVPPEMIETFRLSTSNHVKSMFVNALTKSGNLTIVVDHPKPVEKKTPKSKWGCLMQETHKIRKYNTASRGQFSQTRKMRTCAATFRSTSLEILKNLSVGGGSGGTHFVRCIRADLEGKPKGFYREVVKQQIRALAILDTAKARQRGYPHRIPFQEFLRRYKFLAFDFDENVDMTKDNCRLLLIRLKMEGWVIGKTKVFLKYYNEEYLSRLYETQVKKIVKVQCMLRAFLARKATKSTKAVKKELAKKASIQRTATQDISDEQAAVMIQKAYRGHAVRKELGPVLKGGELDQGTKDFMRYYSSKWRSKSMFQVLLQYRAARYQDLVQFSQQVHLYSQALQANLQTTIERVPLERIDPGMKVSAYLGQSKPPQVNKLPFNIHQEFPYFDSSYMNDPRKAHSKRGGAGDPNVPVRCPPEEVPKSRQDSVYQPTTSSRTKLPLAPNAHHSRSNNYDGTGSLRSRKKVPPPPIPINAMAASSRGYGGQNFDAPSRNNEQQWDYGDRMQSREFPGENRVNPIQEMQRIGRRNNNNDDEEDEPPFNFQAMLRKTNHPRGSMKRNPVYESYAGAGPSSSSPPHNRHQHHHASSDYNRSNREDPYESAAANKSGSSRVDSPEWSPNEMVRMSEKYGREGAWGGEPLDSPRMAHVEIAPGITVHGYVHDL